MSEKTSYFRNKETMHTVTGVLPEHPKGAMTSVMLSTEHLVWGLSASLPVREDTIFSLVINNQFVGKNSEVR